MNWVEKFKAGPFFFRYVFWYHNDRMVNYDVERGISVFTSSGGGEDDDAGGGGGGKTKSQFIVAEATPSDSGNYTCKPSNAVPASIQVFVSNTRGSQSILNLFHTLSKLRNISFSVDKTEALHKQSSLQISSSSSAAAGSSSSSSLSSQALLLMIFARLLHDYCQHHHWGKQWRCPHRTLSALYDDHQTTKT